MSKLSQIVKLKLFRTAHDIAQADRSLKFSYSQNLRGGLIMFRLSAVLIATVSAVALTQVASAADMPVKAPPTAVVASSGGVYVWVDGSYQSVPLPTFDLGFKFSSAAGNPDLGSAQSFDPTATGGGVSGAIGFFVPWLYPTARIEIGGGYIHASDNQSGTAGAFPSATQLVSGRVVDFGCVPGCNFASTLNTTFTSWNINAKGAIDFRSGTVVWSPYLQVFGGRSKNDQDFRQSFASAPASAVGVAPQYLATSDLHWTDWGARLGLDVNVLFGQFVFGLGGNVGVADRSASLSANDSYVAAFNSAVSATSNITPFLANAEVNVGYRLLPGATFKAFVGLNYDSAVPGISRPTYAGPAAFNLQGAPAGIKHESETSWYAGGRLVMNFGSIR